MIFKLTQNRISGNLLKLLRDFLSEKRQRVVLNGQTSTWTNVTTGVPQGSILGSLLFLIYINDLSEGFSTNAKLFADDTSLFSVIYNSQTSANVLNKNLKIIHNWAFQWKMNVNPDGDQCSRGPMGTNVFRNLQVLLQVSSCCETLFVYLIL